MTATYKTSNGRIVFQVTGETHKALWKQIAELEATFGADSACGMCNKTNLQYRHRVAKDKKGEDCDYYELGCGECGARLSFGQLRHGGGLFAKRKTEDGNLLPNRGWAKYEGRTQSKGTAQEPDWREDWR